MIFYENPYSGSRIVPYRRTDATKLIFALPVTLRLLLQTTCQFHRTYPSLCLCYQQRPTTARCGGLTFRYVTLWAATWFTFSTKWTSERVSFWTVYCSVWMYTKVDTATCFGLYTTVFREVTVGPGKLLDCFCSVTVEWLLSRYCWLPTVCRVSYVDVAETCLLSPWRW